MMGMGLGCYNPMGNYPLTSLARRDDGNHHVTLLLLGPCGRAASRIKQSKLVIVQPNIFLFNKLW
jgi:hypothetical protein